MRKCLPVCLSPVCFLALITPSGLCPVPTAGCHPLGLCQQILPNIDKTHTHTHASMDVIHTHRRKDTEKLIIIDVYVVKICRMTPVHNAGVSRLNVLV